MNKRLIRNIERSVLICVILLTIIGLIALYSATLDKDLVDFNEQYQNKNYWKESGLFSTTNIIQLIIFFCSLCYIIYQSFKNKKDNQNVNK